MPLEPVLTQPWVFVCLKCEHHFTPKLLFGVEIRVALTQWKSVRCPNCGARFRSLAIETRPAAAEVPR